MDAHPKIPVFQYEQAFCVSARQLHRQLETTTRFKEWIGNLLSPIENGEGKYYYQQPNDCYLPADYAPLLMMVHGAAKKHPDVMAQILTTHQQILNGDTSLLSEMPSRYALLSIIEQDGKRFVAGRDLYEELEIGSKYVDWVKRSIVRGRLEDGRDYIVVSRMRETTNVDNPLTTYTDHLFSTDAAEHIAMMSETDAGHRVRKYFIECRNKLIEVLQQSKERLQKENDDLLVAQERPTNKSEKPTRQEMIERLRQTIETFKLPEDWDYLKNVVVNGTKPPQQFKENMRYFVAVLRMAIASVQEQWWQNAFYSDLKICKKTWWLAFLAQEVVESRKHAQAGCDRTLSRKCQQLELDGIQGLMSRLYGRKNRVKITEEIGAFLRQRRREGATLMVLQTDLFQIHGVSLSTQAISDYLIRVRTQKLFEI
jgi:phage anti-repressor protein